MRDGAEGAAVAAAMDLLIRYGDALACNRLCDVRNVAGTMTQPSPVKERLVREGGWDKAFAVINLDCDDDIEVPAMSRVAPEGTQVFATDSAKQAHYLPAILGIEAWFGTLEGLRGRRRHRPVAGELAMISLHGRTVAPGYAEGEALVSPEPISGWGGIDPAQGRIIEPRHILNGEGFRGKVLVFPAAKGSSGWSALFQSTRLLGTAPVAMVITRISTKSALGAVVTRVPAVTDLDQDPCLLIRTGDWVRVDATHGLIEVKRATQEA